jgi:hypothetical protein
MRAIEKRILAFLVALVFVSAPGCTMGYDFELSCVVKSAADGKPLSGVTGVFDRFGKIDDLNSGAALSQPSDAEGRLAHKFFGDMIDFNPGERPWYLKLEKEGFFPEVVDVKPTKKPESARSTVPLIVVVYMRPK